MVFCRSSIPQRKVAHQTKTLTHFHSSVNRIETNWAKEVTQIHSGVCGVCYTGEWRDVVSVNSEDDQTSQCTLGLICLWAAWNSWPTSPDSSCIKVCRQRLHTGTDWLWRCVAALATLSAPLASPDDSKICNCIWRSRWNPIWFSTFQIYLSYPVFIIILLELRAVMGALQHCQQPLLPLQTQDAIQTH